MWSIGCLIGWFNLNRVVRLLWFDFIDFTWIGLDQNGLDWIGSDWIRWNGSDRIGSDWIGLDDIIAYPYAWTVNFETCIDLRLTTHQPPIPKTSQAAAWSHKYIGYWNGETEGSPIGFATIFWGFETWNFPWAKVVHFEPLGALFGLGTPEAVLIDFVLGFNSRDVIPYSNEDPLDLKNPCRPRNHCNSLLKWRFAWTNESMSTTKPL